MQKKENKIELCKQGSRGCNFSKHQYVESWTQPIAAPLQAISSTTVWPHWHSAKERDMRILCFVSPSPCTSFFVFVAPDAKGSCPRILKARPTHQVSFLRFPAVSFVRRGSEKRPTTRKQSLRLARSLAPGPNTDAPDNPCLPYAAPFHAAFSFFFLVCLFCGYGCGGKGACSVQAEWPHKLQCLCLFHRFMHITFAVKMPWMHNLEASWQVWTAARIAFLRQK